MKIQFYNSLSNQQEEFQPIEPGVVRMYSCGPTVYDFAHIGNFRSFLFGDLLRRSLELLGMKVIHIMNVTDVGHMLEGEADKMELAASRVKENKKSGRVKEGAIENPNDPYQIAEYYTQTFLEDARRLSYKVAYEYPQSMPRATQHIDGMLEMIERLLEKGHAYIGSDKVVYFSVQSFPEYGKLSGNTLEKILSGAGGRVSEENQSVKQHPGDFMLWKPDSQHLMKWESPWGMGYPGWHIECSVMARKLLERDVIDIHTGGEDLIFPHHECEIAQSCGASGQRRFANFWIHARFLFVEGEKMSKSKGNFYTARDVFEGRVKGEDGKPSGQRFHPAVLRYELIKSHYRANMNFTMKGLLDSRQAVNRFIGFRDDLEKKAAGKTAKVDLSHPVVREFAEALADDLNISAALAVAHMFLKADHSKPEVSLAVWQKINSVLSIAPINEGIEHPIDEASFAVPEASCMSIDQALKYCAEIDAAKKQKDYATADSLRKLILDAGFEVQQSAQGTTIKKPAT
jgi:cysteinyl-tRNA synthetase